jgi:SAM-dependent methyltransferase
MSLALHEISEADHRILNPFTEEKLMTLGAVSRVGPSTRILDLACGKGELLCRWARAFGARGLGVDLSAVFLAAASSRAQELGVVDQVTFHQGDAGDYSAEPAAYNLVSCLGATWIGGDLVGTIALMRKAAAPDGLLLVGEPFWIDPPPAQVYDALGCAPDEFTSLAGLHDRFEAAGTDLVEMVLADGDSWDRYVAAQWWTLTQWLQANRDDARATQVRAFRDDARRAHLSFGRRYLGWGVFVLRLPG